MFASSPTGLKLFYLQEGFYHAVKVGYTIGHSVSLISLIIGIVILCLFR